MENSKLIAVEAFCTSHGIEATFVYSIQEMGLIDIVSVDEAPFIREEHVSDLEKTIRLHRELDINPEGISAIFELLRKVDSLQEEVNFLKNRLRVYE